MSETREIITIQLGNYANFVGTHLWNIQESSFCYNSSQTEKLLLNHDVLFREGISPCGETTFTPRLLSVGLKGSLGTLKKEGTLYDLPQQQQQQHDAASNWSGRVHLLKMETEQRNQFLEDLEKQEQTLYPERQIVFDEDKDICLDPNSRKCLDSSFAQRRKLYDLNDSVRFWSDFLRPHLHPRSIYLLDNYFYDQQQESFDLYGVGLQVYKEENTREELEEVCRKMAEECNYMQGFNLLMDSQDGFSGLASGLLQHLKDEYGNKSVHSYPLCQPAYAQKEGSNEDHRLLNFLFCLESVILNSDLFAVLNTGRGTYQDQQAQLNFNNINYQTSSYHTSALLAAWLNAATFNFRLKTNPSTMKEQTQLLTPSERKCLAASLSLPFPLGENSFLSEMVKGDLSLTPLTPYLDVLSNSEIAVQSLTLAGIPSTMFEPSSRATHQRRNPQEIIVQSLKPFWASQFSTVNIIGVPCHVATPFPNFFNDQITEKGFLTDSKPRSANMGVESVPLLSGLHNTDSVATLFKKTLNEATKLKMENFRSYFEAGIEKDDFLETKNTLMNFAENYRADIFKEN